MKEFIEKLIGRLEKQAEQYRRRGFEHEQKGYSAMADKYYGKQCSYLHSIEIVNELAEEYRNDKVCQTAIMYAKNLHKYGVQIDSIWETATQQSMALNQAYMRGRQDERDIFDEWQEKHINTSTDTSSDISTDTSSGWIACSERLPDESGEYLTFVEYEGRKFIAIDDIDCDGIFKKWNCTSDYHIIAWQPLPKPYKE